MRNSVTLSETLNELRTKGYTEDFNVRTDCIICRDGQFSLHPEDFIVDHYYRFEGETNPSDSAILYAISSEKHNLKGVLVNAYGIYSDPISDALMEKLTIQK